MDSGQRQRQRPSRGVTWGCLCLSLCGLLLPAGGAAAAAANVLQGDALWQDHDRLLVRLQLEVDLDAALQAALASGIHVNFFSEVRFLQARRILGERQLTSGSQQARLGYSALSRHYVVTDLERQVREFAPTLGDALELLERRLGRILLVLDPVQLESGRRHRLEARVQLQLLELPVPLQWDARLRGTYRATGRWYRWTFE
jgi:hypothetical protein